MLNIAKIKNGIVIDHIKAGQGMRVFNWLGLDKAPYTVALVVNAGSKHMERKDIIKIDNEIAIDLTILGLIDPNITVNVITSAKIYYMEGEVDRPQEYPLSRRTTLLQAIATAGGPNDFANEKNITITRNGQLLKFNAKHIEDHPDQDPQIEAGDRIKVHRSMF